MTKLEISKLAHYFATKPGMFGERAIFAKEVYEEVFIEAYNTALKEAIDQLAWDEDNVSHGCIHKSILDNLKIK